MLAFKVMSSSKRTTHSLTEALLASKSSIFFENFSTLGKNQFFNESMCSILANPSRRMKSSLHYVLVALLLSSSSTRFRLATERVSIFCIRSSRSSIFLSAPSRFRSRSTANNLARPSVAPSAFWPENIPFSAVSNFVLSAEMTLSLANSASSYFLMNC